MFGRYGALLLLDTEDDFGAAEVAKLHADVLLRGLSVVVLAEWHNAGVMKAVSKRARAQASLFSLSLSSVGRPPTTQRHEGDHRLMATTSPHPPPQQQVRFFDANTHAWMEPVTGGANLPALNELLGPLGVSFGSHVLRGELSVGDRTLALGSAAPIARLGARGWLVRASKLHDEAAKLSGILPLLRPRYDVPVVGLIQPAAPGAGRVAAFGDTECVDSAALTPTSNNGRSAAQPCWWLVQAREQTTGLPTRAPTALLDAPSLPTHALRE